jgi:hypothetical protein
MQAHVYPDTCIHNHRQSTARTALWLALCGVQVGLGCASLALGAVSVAVDVTMRKLSTGCAARKNSKAQASVMFDGDAQGEGAVSRECSAVDCRGTSPRRGGFEREVSHV